MTDIADGQKEDQIERLQKTARDPIKPVADNREMT